MFCLAPWQVNSFRLWIHEHYFTTRASSKTSIGRYCDLDTGKYVYTQSLIDRNVEGGVFFPMPWHYPKCAHFQQKISMKLWVITYDHCLKIAFVLSAIELRWRHGYLFCKKKPVRHALIWSATFINFPSIHLFASNNLRKNFHFCAFTLLFLKLFTLILTKFTKVAQNMPIWNIW